MDGQNPNSSKPKGNLKNTKKTCGSYVFDSGMKTSIFRSWRWTQNSPSPSIFII
jgi:hypothetical protein